MSQVNQVLQLISLVCILAVGILIISDHTLRTARKCSSHDYNFIGGPKLGNNLGELATRMEKLMEPSMVSIEPYYCWDGELQGEKRGDYCYIHNPSIEKTIIYFQPPSRTVQDTPKILSYLYLFGSVVVFEYPGSSKVEQIENASLNLWQSIGHRYGWSNIVLVGDSGGCQMVAAICSIAKSSRPIHTVVLFHPRTISFHEMKSMPTSNTVLHSDYRTFSPLTHVVVVAKAGMTYQEETIIRSLSTYHRFVHLITISSSRKLEGKYDKPEFVINKDLTYLLSKILSQQMTVSGN